MKPAIVRKFSLTKKLPKQAKICAFILWRAKHYVGLDTYNFTPGGYTVLFEKKFPPGS